jgi:nicotinamidase-related amidase
MGHPWDDLLSEQDRAVISQAGYDQRGAVSWDSRALGKTPAVLIIDMQRILVGQDVPILDAVKEERLSMGQIAWRAMEHIVPFIETCRNAELPIVYTRVIPRGRSADEDAVQIVEPLAPAEEDWILDKNYSSAFYGTSLLTHLNKLRADTVIVVGNSTSGCVRATVVDARQMGFSVLVPQECTFDRIEASHKIGLLDMWMKYATVVPIEEALAYVTGLS